MQCYENSHKFFYVSRSKKVKKKFLLQMSVDNIAQASEHKFF